MELQTTILVPRPVAETPKLRALVYCGEDRHPTLPDTPTAKELGYDMVPCLNNFWWAPAGTPAAAAEKMAGVFETAMQDTDLIAEMEAKGQSVAFFAGQELTDRLDGFYSGLSSVASDLQ